MAATAVVVVGSRLVGGEGEELTVVAAEWEEAAAEIRTVVATGRAQVVAVQSTLRALIRIATPRHHKATTPHTMVHHSSPP